MTQKKGISLSSKETKKEILCPLFFYKMKLQKLISLNPRAGTKLNKPCFQIKFGKGFQKEIQLKKEAQVASQEQNTNNIHVLDANLIISWQKQPLCWIG